MTPRTSTFAQGAVGAAVVLTCVLFLPAAADPLNVVKLTALCWSALCLLLWASAKAVVRRKIGYSMSPAAASAVALLLALGVSALTAPVLATAVVGAYGRNSGLLAFGAAITLYLTVILTFERKATLTLFWAITGSGAFTAVYGQLQVLDIDPIAWDNPFNPIVATLGNSNFASAYLGVTLPLAGAGALWSGWSRTPRLTSATIAILTLAVALQSEAVQGPIAAAAGLAVLVLALLLNLSGRRRVLGMSVFVMLSALGGGALAAGALWSAGPAASFFAGIAYQARLWYWEAAIRMFSEHPVVGVGLSHYGEFWRTTRPPASVPGLGDESYSDSAHSVFLQMFAQGGLLLGLAYLAFVLIVGFALTRGLMRATSSDRVLLGGFGGAWAAFQVQSLVSIDQVPLIVLHFVLSAAVVVLAGGVVRRSWTPRRGAGGRASTITSKRDRRRQELSVAQRDATTMDVIFVGALGLLALILAGMALAPLRANIAIRSGDQQLARGQGNPALASYEKATDLMPGVAFHWIKQGSLLRNVNQPARALDAFEEATRRDPFAVAGFSAGAATAEEVGDLEQSRQMHNRAVALDPWDVDNIVAAARFELRHAGADKARSLLESAIRRLPADPDLWAALGDARAVLGDAALARAAYDRALAIEPEHQLASEGLEKLRDQPA